MFFPQGTASFPGNRESHERRRKWPESCPECKTGAQERVASLLSSQKRLVKYQLPWI